MSTKLLKQRAKVLVAAGALAMLVLTALPGAAEAQQEDARNTHPIAQPATPVQAMPEPVASEPAEPVASEPAASDSEPAAAASTESAFGLSERQLLGLGIVVLTLIVALLILWKAPLRRDVGGGAWRMPAPEKYPTNHSAFQLAPTATGAGRPAFALSGSESGSGGFGNRALTNGQIHDDERRSWDRACKPADRRRIRALRAKGGEKYVPLYAGVASVLPASLWRKRGGREVTYRSSPAVRFYGHVALAEAAVGRKRKNPLRSRASLSRRPLRKGWAAAVYSPQVRRSLEHAIRTETQSTGVR